ncbi:hypothetical protein AAHS21_15865 [Mycobacterium sp. 050272]|uniref:hypothetical protein n=1 Tax=Mycobacterium sp. 050272 TaxID=3142488 RepID=UPI003198314E
MENVIVDPTYIDNLRTSLAAVRTSVYAAFGAPRSVTGGYPDKLIDSHGLTARAGANAMMATLDGNRAAVQARLAECLTACDQALQAAKAMYAATDGAQRDVLDHQLDAGN